MTRLARLAVVGTIALGSTMAAASAAPIIPNSFSQTNPSIVHVWGGCGWGFHPTPWGRCAEPLGLPPISALLWISSALAVLLRWWILSILASPVLVRVLTGNRQQSCIKEE